MVYASKVYDLSREEKGKFKIHDIMVIVITMIKRASSVCPLTQESTVLESLALDKFQSQWNLALKTEVPLK